MSELKNIFSENAHPTRIAFVGNYLPRQCGIATFTYDLYRSFRSVFPKAECMVVAVDDKIDGYDYPDEVRFNFFQDDEFQFEQAAHFLNSQQIEVVCLQHEYGIYGANCGKNVLRLMETLNMPIVTTLHTTLKEPNGEQYEILKKIVELSSRVIVMSKQGKTFLTDIYGVPVNKIEVFPHGVPDMPFVDTHFYKDSFEVADKQTLLTFGLLSPNKGIETVIRALPSIVSNFPDVVYMVVGATHPHIIRQNGEQYRNSLRILAKELGVEKNVIFYNEFVSNEKLLEFIGAADIYISPYLNEAQITSGALAYCFGCGKAIISTPYWHAQELLSDNNGLLNPFGDSNAIATNVNKLLYDPLKRNAMRKKVYLLGREMIWEKVIQQYEKTFSAAQFEKLQGNHIRYFKTSSELTLEADQLPAIKIDHLSRLTDLGVGIFQHARYNIPNYSDGYCVDDNARALIFTLTLQNLNAFPFKRIKNMVEVYASFINHAYNLKENLFHNFMSYERTWLDEVGSNDSQGRTIWALGYMIDLAPSSDLQQWALELFRSCLPKFLSIPSPRTWAYALLGIKRYTNIFQGDRRINHIQKLLEDKLMDLYRSQSSTSWNWFEQKLAYDNPRLSQALIISDRQECREAGLSSLIWLKELQTASQGYFQPIGSNGFYENTGKRAFFDQQPIEACAMTSAALSAYHATGQKEWIEEAQKALDWFLGKNDLGVSLYDPTTGGCYDGLHIDNHNKNQGAESTLCFLTALTELKNAYANYGNGIAAVRSLNLTGIPNISAIGRQAV